MAKSHFAFYAPQHREFVMNEDLQPLATKLSARLAVKPEVVVTHPAELRLLKAMTDDELRKFAAAHGWGVVRRLGGLQIEFYNDAGARTGP